MKRIITAALAASMALAINSTETLAQPSSGEIKRALVKCVQRGLTEAAVGNSAIEDPRGIDGGIGNGTMGSAASWQAAFPDNTLPVLTRNADAPTLRDWCYTVEPPTVLFGQVFQVIKMANDSGEYRISDRGPAYVQLHEEAFWTRVLGFHNGRWENNVTPKRLSGPQRAFLNDLPAAEKIEVLGTTNRIAPDFFTGFNVDKVWGDNFRTYAMSEDESGVLKVVVFNEDDPYHLMIIGTAEAWGEGLEAAADWKLMEDTFGVSMPGAN